MIDDLETEIMELTEEAEVSKLKNFEKNYERKVEILSTKSCAQEKNLQELNHQYYLVTLIKSS